MRNGKKTSLKKEDIHNFADAQWVKNQHSTERKNATMALSTAQTLEEKRLASNEWHYVTVTSKVGRPITKLVRKDNPDYQEFNKKSEINPCKCGSKNTPDLNSDDMIPCWMVKCLECKQSHHSESSKWTRTGAIVKWNKENPLPIVI
jgi:hypothetical protein